MSTYGQYWIQTDYILCSWRWRSSIQSAKKRPGADCGSDHELRIAKFRLTLKKVAKSTRPFRYNVNKITYSTVEVTDRFKRLDLLDGVPEELWTEVRNIVQEVVIKTTPKKKEMRNSKMVVWEGLKNSWEKKRSKMQRRKGKIYPSECRVTKNTKERYESLPQWSMQRNREKQ